MANEINKKIKMIRKRKGLKSKDAAIHLGLSPSGYSKLENEGTFSLEQIKKIAAFLSVCEEFILKDEENRTSSLILSDIITENPKQEKIVPFTTTHNEQELIKALREISIKSGSSDYFNSILIEVKAKREKDNAK